MARPGHNCGFTLIEMVIVVAILMILAGIVVPMFSGIRDNSVSVATTATLRTIRDAIVGSGPGQPGYLSDMGGLPVTMRDLFVMPTGASPFDPVTRRGWRGPYLLEATGTYPVNDGYGTKGDPAVLDSWGQPIVIQGAPTASDPNPPYIRLVSAGPDGIIQTPNGDLYPLPTQRGDDVVLFLMRADTP
jgi:prepilin-type N-terminal cleavage/methylation domain-containing protein